MTRLTDDQARAFQAVRAQINQALTAAHDAAVTLSVTCDHEGSAPDCPVCAVWDAASSAADALNKASCELNAALTRS